MSDIVAIFTARMGHPVVLTRERWEKHILVEHDGMREQLPCIARVLSAPKRITQDANLSTHKCFYRDEVVHGSRSLIKVVDEFDDPWLYVQPRLDLTPVQGTIITAYETDKIKRGERRLWPP